jgi:hypothetical protein
MPYLMLRLPCWQEIRLFDPCSDHLGVHASGTGTSLCHASHSCFNLYTHSMDTIRHGRRTLFVLMLYCVTTIGEGGGRRRRMFVMRAWA